MRCLQDRTHHPNVPGGAFLPAVQRNIQRRLQAAQAPVLRDHKQHRRDPMMGLLLFTWPGISAPRFDRVVHGFLRVQVGRVTRPDQQFAAVRSTWAPTRMGSTRSLGRGGCRRRDSVQQMDRAGCPGDEQERPTGPAGMTVAVRITVGVSSRTARWGNVLCPADGRATPRIVRCSTCTGCGRRSTDHPSRACSPAPSRPRAPPR